MHAEHNQTQVVKIVYDFNEEINELLKKTTPAKWSNTMNCWYVLRDEFNLNQFFVSMNELAWIDYSALKSKKNETKQNSAIHLVREKIDKGMQLTEGTVAQMASFKGWMQQKRYSENTIKTYSEAIKTFLKYYHLKNTADITNDDLIEFNRNYILRNGYSTSFQNQIINAIKLFFIRTENRCFKIEQIERPRREHKLPNVLSKEEIAAILTASANLKHRTMLSLIYACGLRRSELLNLKPIDVDSKRNLLIIRQSKGKKDRITPISNRIIQLLREYFKAYKPVIWLFEGQNKGEQYSAGSLQQVLKQSIKKVGIRKPVTLHWLRHSYATHLLESGTDLRYIQELLGHNSSRTTEIYTHVSKKSIQQIKSPFDDLKM